MALDFLFYFVRCRVIIITYDTNWGKEVLSQTTIIAIENTSLGLILQAIWKFQNMGHHNQIMYWSVLIWELDCAFLRCLKLAIQMVNSADTDQTALQSDLLIRCLRRNIYPHINGFMVCSEAKVINIPWILHTTEIRLRRRQLHTSRAMMPAGKKMIFFNLFLFWKRTLGLNFWRKQSILHCYFSPFISLKRISQHQRKIHFIWELSHEKNKTRLQSPIS